MLRPWAAVLGKWLRNLSDVLLALLGIEVLLSIVSLYIRIPMLSGEEGAKILSSWYLLPSIAWLMSSVLGGFLEYCPKEKPDKRPEKKAKQNPMQEELLDALMSGKSAAVTKELFSPGEGPGDEWLSSWLYDCFQLRRRTVFLCADEQQSSRWREYLHRILDHTYDKSCIVRIGGVMEIQNRQDIDILIITCRQMVLLEPDRVYSFWYREAQTVVLTDTHRILAQTGGCTDALFALWNKKETPMQYVFLACTGGSQERQAAEYYAGQEIFGFGSPSLDCGDLVPWRLDSQRGRMRRLLLAMEQERGVSEAWVKKQQERFGMEALGTEEFLTHVLHAVFPDYQVSNLYDTFLFQEETEERRGSWWIRLTDRAAMELLNEAGDKGALCSESDLPAGKEKTEIVSFPDQVYHIRDMAPLLAALDQENKRMILYQAAVSHEKRGTFAFPAAEGVPDFSRESYYEEEVRTPMRTMETTLLRVLIPLTDAGQDSRILSALLSVVSGQVLLELFPYHQGAVSACCTWDSERRSLISRIIPEEENGPSEHCITVDLVENGPWEQGLTALLRQNSREFFEACRGWLSRAKQDAGSREAALLLYAQAQLGRPAEELDGAGQLLALLQ